MELNEIKDLILKAKESNAPTLDLWLKGLTSLPPEISELKNLTELNISHNEFTLLPPEISELKNLTELNISYNEFTLLPPEISELKNLTVLDMSHNEFTSLPPEISKLKNLTTFYIHDNEFTSLPPEISKLKNLTTFYISFNEFTSLPPEISKLKNLTKLNMDRNEFTSLPPEILKFCLDIKWAKAKYQEKGIFIEGNPLKNPPIEIVKQGREAILRYYNSLENDFGEEIDENCLMEILQKMGTNEKEIQKILQNIQKNESESNAEDSLLENINRIITLNLTFFGIGPNFNEMIRLYLERKKRQS